MPAYSFKERFVDLVLTKKKRQTIRSKRKYPTRPGQTAYLFYGLRTKHTKRLGKEPIRNVQSIEITPSGAIAIDMWILSKDQKEQLAKDDGFSDFSDFMEFWTKEHFKKDPANFIGEIIYW